MPVKRRVEKRRVDPEREMFVWSSIFSSDCDFFGELPSIGVPTDEYGRPDPEAAREAWMRLGAAWLNDPMNSGSSWALGNFGELRCR